MTYEIIKTEVGVVFLGGDGILRHRMANNSNLNLEDAKELLISSKKISGGKKRPVLVYVSGTKSMSREARACLSGEESAGLFSAVALLIDSPITKVLANFFVGLNKPFFPTKVFTDEKLALEWLWEYRLNE